MSSPTGAHDGCAHRSGYPKGLLGDQIPIETRIITILDIFDALVATDRPYKKGMQIDTALSILKKMADTEGKLDPVLTQLFTESRCWEKEEVEDYAQNVKKNIFLASVRMKF